MSWVPLSKRGEDTWSYEGPFEDVPDWLFGPLWTWCANRIPLYDSGSLRRGAVGEYRSLAMALRISLDDPAHPNPSDARTLQANLLERIRRDEPMLLDVADYFVSLEQPTAYSRPSRAAEQLESILTEAGSAWTVLWSETPSLARRLSDEELQHARAAFEEGRPGAILRRGWQAAYGRDPQPDTAYREAVRAVEAAGIPVVSPRNERATLGTMIADLRAAPQKWHVELGAGLPEEDRVLSIVTMMELLWKGQHDRHGTPNPDAPLNVSQSESEAAIQLALVLVRWLTSGTIRPTG